MKFEIPPLRKRKKDGTLYVRPQEIEHLIVETLELSFDDFILRAKQLNRSHPEYLPSEILVHRIRATRSHNSDAQFNALYLELKRRIRSELP